MTLFKNARLVGRTTDDLFSVLVKDGCVAQISSSGDSGHQEDGETIDLDGLWLSPSFVDHHVHFTQWAQTLQRLDLTKARSVAETCEIVKARLEHNRDATDGPTPCIGFGFQVGFWQDLDLMRKETLDELSSEVMIVLLSRDIHSMWCNSTALKFFGYNPAEETGILRETPCFEAIKKLPAVSDEILDEWVAVAAKDAAQKGVTEIIDLEMAHNLEQWSRRIQQKGFDTLRVHFGMYSEHIGDATSVGLKSGDVIKDCKGLLVVGPYKIITDGSLGTRTAYCHQPYPLTEDYGLFTYPPQTLQEMMQHGVRNGLRLAVHAIGDKANSLTLEAFASLDKIPSGSSIEHAQLLTWDDIPLFQSLNLIASVQPDHIEGDRELCNRFWPERHDRAYPFRTMIDKGITLKLGSDAPVSVLDPCSQMATAISREWEDEAGPWHPEQIITNLEAFVASTSGGRSTISEGDQADLIVLEADPLKCSGTELRKLNIRATMLDGRFTHRDL